MRTIVVQERLPYKRLVTQNMLDHGTNQQGGARLVANRLPENQEIPDGLSSSTEKTELDNKGLARPMNCAVTIRNGDNKEDITVEVSRPSGITVKGRMLPRQQISGKKRK